MAKQYWWLCYECNNVMNAVAPPSKCPKCNKSGSFNDITLYVPKNAPNYLKTIVCTPEKGCE